MTTIAKFDKNKSRLLENSNALMKQAKENAVDTTHSVWSNIKEWFVGFPKRFDAFEDHKIGFLDIFKLKR